MICTNKELVDKANDIFTDIFYTHLPNISELAFWSNYVPIWESKGQSLQEILLDFKRDDQWWEENLGVVAKEATTKFNNWVSENNVETVYNSIDEKGLLFAPVSVTIEVLIDHAHKVTIVHPVTKEEIVYNYNMPSVTINDMDLNQANKTPDDVVFYSGLEGEVIGKAYPLV